MKGNQKPKSIDQAFKDIDKQFDATQKKNKYLKYALLTPIHEKYPYAQNGITAMIASMGSGKTYTYLKLMKQQEVLFDDAFYELIVICSTSNKFDATVNAFKPLITKSKLVAIKDTDLLEFLNKYMRRILKFNALNKYMVNSKDVDEEMTRLCNKHQLKLDSTKPKDVEKLIKYVTNKIEKYQWRTFPHRCLLVLDDFASHPEILALRILLSALENNQIIPNIAINTIPNIGNVARFIAITKTDTMAKFIITDISAIVIGTNDRIAINSFPEILIFRINAVINLKPNKLSITNGIPIKTGTLNNPNIDIFIKTLTKDSNSCDKTIIENTVFNETCLIC